MVFFSVRNGSSLGSALSVVFVLFFLAFLSWPVSGVHYSVSNQTTCACEFATLKLHAENLQGQFVHEDLSLVSNLETQPGFVDVQLEPGQTKIFPVYVHASCQTPPGVYSVSFEPAQVQAWVKVKDCSVLSLTVTPEQSSCQNENVLFSVTVENFADFSRNVSLGSDLNPDSYVLPSFVTLEPRQRKTVVLSVNTNTQPMRLPFLVFARAGDQVVQQAAVIDVGACSGFRADGPLDWPMLAGQNSTIVVRMQNLGVSRLVTFKAFCPSFVRANATRLTLASGQSADVELDAESAPFGSFTCTVLATTEDDGRTFSHTVSIDVRPLVSNYSVEPASITLEEGVVQRFSFGVKNSGRLETASLTFSSNATRVVSGPSFLSPLEVQNATFALVTDCSAYPFNLTRGGARPLCPQSVEGFLRIDDTLFPINVRIVQPSLVFDSKAYAVQGGVRLDVVVTNLGNATELHLSSLPRARGPATVLVPAFGQAFFSVFVDVNASRLDLEAQTERGTYLYRADLSVAAGAGSISGLVTFAVPVVAFSLAVLLALALLYVLYRRGV